MASARDVQQLNVQGHVEWDNVPYAPGTIQAIGYNNGVAVMTNTVVNHRGAGADCALAGPQHDPGRRPRCVSGDSGGLDAQGHVVPTATNLVQFTLTRRRDYWRRQRQSQFP